MVMTSDQSATEAGGSIAGAHWPEQAAAEGGPQANGRHPLGSPEQAQRPTVTADERDIDPYADWRPPPLPPGRAFSGRDLLFAAIVAGVLVVLGAPIGLLWSALAPHATAAQTSGGAIYTGFNNEVFFAADGILGAMGLAIGILAGIAAYTWRSRRGPWMAVALALGGAAGSALAAYVGHQIGLATFNPLVGSGPVGVQFSAPVGIRAYGVLLIEPLAAVLVYVVTAGWSKYGDLRRGDFDIPPEIWGDEPPPEEYAANSDSGEPAAPPTGQGPPAAAGASSPPA
jgi:hypothetical protein